MRNVSRVVLASLTTLGLMASPALAHTSAHDDLDDTAGSIDIKRSAILHSDPQFTVGITLYETPEDASAWAALLDPECPATPNCNSIDLALDKNLDGREDFRVRVYGQEGTLHGSLFKWVGEEPVYKREVVVQTPFSQYLAITIKKRWLGFTGRKAIKWSPLSTYFDEGECLEGCIDTAPSDTGWYRHRV